MLLGINGDLGFGGDNLYKSLEIHKYQTRTNAFVHKNINGTN
jgi:hypothetical protein